MSGFKINGFNIVLIVLGGLALLFIISPLLNLFMHSSYAEVFETSKDQEVQASIIRTLLISFSATLFFAFLSLPLSFVLARRDFTGKRLVLGLIDLPIVIPHSAAGIAVLGFISRDSVLGEFAGLFGLNLVGHPVGIALAMAFVSIPFLINSARDGFPGGSGQAGESCTHIGRFTRSRFLYHFAAPCMEKHIVWICADVWQGNE